MAHDLTVVHMPTDVRVGTQRWQARYVIVSDSRDELADGHPEFQRQLWEMAQGTIERKKLQGKQWIIGLGPQIDDPDWADGMAPEVVTQVRAQLAEHPEYHWRTAALIDIADLEVTE